MKIGRLTFNIEKSADWSKAHFMKVTKGHIGMDQEKAYNIFDKARRDFTSKAPAKKEKDNK